MLIPKEKPYLTGLNSYYLHVDKCIEHLQGEIGSGCLYCQASDQELLVYFDEREIVRGVIQKNGEHAKVSQSLDPVIQRLSQKNFTVTIYYLEASAIFFWGQMPPFKRAKSTFSSTDIRLQNLSRRLEKKKFSGFIDITVQDHGAGAILFFHQGERKVGSYSWGNGGGSPFLDDYNRLLDVLQSNVATFAVGQFIPESMSSVSASTSNERLYLSSLTLATKEFIEIYIRIARRKSKADPLVELKQKFLDHIDEYSVLDPFRSLYEIKHDGAITFADNVPKEEIASGIVDCVWKVIEDRRLEKSFRTAIKNWDYKTALEDRGINVDR